MSQTSKSEEIADEFIKLKLKYTELDKQYNNLSVEVFPWEQPGDEGLIKIDKEKNHIDVTIFFLINRLYKASIKDNFYFFDCPFSVYENTYDSRLSKFLSSYIDADEIDFLKKEINNLYYKSSTTIKGYDYSLFIGNNKQYEYSSIKKKKYLKDKILKLGYQVEEFSGDIINQQGELIFTKIETTKSIDENTYSNDIDFALEKEKSLEHNISKLTIAPIFLNEESQNLFYTIIEHMGIEESNIGKRGNQAKFHAIWEVKDCKMRIFKPLILKSDYTSFLNEKYNTKYDSRSFSDGGKYHPEIKRILASL